MKTFQQFTEGIEGADSAQQVELIEFASSCEKADNYMKEIMIRYSKEAYERSTKGDSKSLIPDLKQMRDRINQFLDFVS